LDVNPQLSAVHVVRPAARSRAIRLPIPPAGLAAVLRAAEAEDRSLHELASLVEKEPALTTHLLKMANSAAFGVGQPVRSATQAAILLGARAVRNIALGHILQVMTLRVDGGSFDTQSFWQHSLKRASAALTLAELAGYEDESEAFTAGLIQDLGVLALAVMYPDLALDLTASLSAPIELRLERERQLFDRTHADVFAELASSWNMPSDLARAIAAHHDPQPFSSDEVIGPELRRVQRLAELLRVGDIVAELMTLPATFPRIQRVQSLLRTVKSRSPLDLGEIMERMAVHMHDMCAVLDVKVDETPTLDDLVTTAHRLVERISFEYEERTRRLEAELREKERVAKDLETRNSSLNRQARTDVLTGVANRRELMERLETLAIEARADRRPISVVICDLDHFKQVNDTRGHDAGDVVLREAAQRLSSGVRTHDLVARLGGEEFAVILVGCSRANGPPVAERLRARLARSPVPLGDGEPQEVRGSFGGTTLDPGDASSIDEVLRRADLALYQSKAQGRDRVTWWG
jgi:diguanylate cyclase (GGDEF)-like protein